MKGLGLVGRTLQAPRPEALLTSRSPQIAVTLPRARFRSVDDPATFLAAHRSEGAALAPPGNDPRRTEESRPWIRLALFDHGLFPGVASDAPPLSGVVPAERSRHALRRQGFLFDAKR